MMNNMLYINKYKIYLIIFILININRLYTFNWYRKCTVMGIAVADKTFHSHRFADDQIIHAYDQQDMEHMLRI